MAQGQARARPGARHHLVHRVIRGVGVNRWPRADLQQSLFVDRFARPPAGRGPGAPRLAARLPMGMLTDRFGGRLVFPALLAFSSVAAWFVPSTGSYGSLLVAAFLIGMAGSSFAVGAAFVSRWTPAARRAPRLASTAWGRWDSRSPCLPARWSRLGSDGRWCFAGPACCCCSGRAIFAASRRVTRSRPSVPPAWARCCRCCGVRRRPGSSARSTSSRSAGSSRSRSTCRPSCGAQFGLMPADAGFRAAGFVVLATLMRPVGGWLADRIGGAQVLSWVFGGVALFALLLAWPSMVPFTVGALGCAMLLGLGNGAVFELVPEHFPEGHRDGDRTGRRTRRTRRVLPPAARRVPRSPRASSGQASSCYRPRRWRSVSQPTRLPPERHRVDTLADSAVAPTPRAREGRRVGNARDGRRWPSRSWWDRGTSSTSTPRWSVTRSPRCSPRSGSATATRCG